MGLFFVTVVTLLLALYSIFGGLGDWSLGMLFTVGGLLIMSVSFKAYQVSSEFGYEVFGLVGFGVVMTGLCVLFPEFDSIGNYVNLTFALVFVLTVVWSGLIRNFKTLTALLITTALIFLTEGLSGIFPDFDVWHYLIGISSLLTALFSIYLAFTLSALEGKVRCF